MTVSVKPLISSNARDEGYFFAPCMVLVSFYVIESAAGSLRLF